MKIIKTYFEGKTNDIEKMVLKLESIQVLDNAGQAWQNVAETVKFRFHSGYKRDDKEVIFNTHFVVIFEIDTGYIHEDFVLRDLCKGFERFNITNIKALKEGFRYRQLFQYKK